MNQPLRLVFWQNVLAFHQVAHIRALSEAGHEVIWVAGDSITDSLGWVKFDAGAVKTVVTNDPQETRAILSERPDQSWHIFSGIRGHSNVELAFNLSRFYPVKRALLIEQRDDRGRTGKLRLLRFRWDRWRTARQVKAVFCMGYTGPHGGRQWYRRCGYRDDEIVPYGYFVDAPAATPQLHGAPETQLMYLGQMIERKGVHVLVQAAAALRKRRPELGWKLKLMGNGESRESYEAMARDLGVASRLEWMAAAPNDIALGHVAQSDCLVLPSRFDGWGVVVNEALLRGVPVICSDYCGAKDLVRAPWRGDTFPCGDAEALSRVLEKWIERGPKTRENTQRILDWSSNIRGAVAAGYLLDCLGSLESGAPRPPAPWLSDD